MLECHRTTHTQHQLHATMYADTTRRLPVELLAEIFLLLKREDGDNRYGFRAPWIRVTWVCKRWREIAINLPSLWTSVALVPQSASLDAASTRTLWERVGNSALNLFIDLEKASDADISRTFEVVQLTGKAVGALRLHYLKKSSLKVHTGLRQLHKDQLTSLELLCDVDYKKMFKWVFDPSEFPALHSLTIQSALPGATAPLLHLRRLTVSRVDVAPDDSEDLLCLHDFLRYLPLLEELSVEASLPDTDSYDSGSIPVVPVPRLRHLHIDELLLDVAPFLTPLRLPALRYLSMKVRTGGVSGGNVFWDVFPDNPHEVLPILTRTNTFSLRCGATALDENAIDLRGSTISEELLDLPGREDNSYEWSLTVPYMLDNDQLDGGELLGSQCADLLDNMPRVLDCTQMLRLELHIAHGMPIERDWHTWLAQFPKLRILSVGSGELVRHLLEALRGDAAGLLLPELEKLSLCVGYPADAPPYKFLYSELFTWLVRKARNGRLSSVTVRVPESRAPAMVEEVSIARMLLGLLRLATEVRDAQVVAGHCSSCHAVYAGAGSDVSEDMESSDVQSDNQSDSSAD